MLFLMCVSLFTSRVVLNTLGVTDYGIYNVVGGVVAMFGFINGSMASSHPKIYNLCSSWKMWHGERSASVQHSIADS